MATAPQAVPSSARPPNGLGFPNLDDFQFHRSSSQPVGLERAFSSTQRGIQLRILIADHHEVVRVGLKSVLESRMGWQVVAESDNGKDAIAQATKTHPDVAIVDSALPLVSGAEVARQIRAHLPETEVLLFAAYRSEALVNAALVAGARAILLKSDAKENLIAAVDSLAAHSAFVVGETSEPLVQAFLSSQSARAKIGLTSRQIAVIRLIAEGHSNKEISRILNLSIKTVESHRAAAMRSLGVNSTATLVRCAIREGLVEP